MKTQLLYDMSTIVAGTSIALLGKVAKENNMARKLNRGSKGLKSSSMHNIDAHKTRDFKSRIK